MAELVDLVAERVRSRRVALGLTQAALAEASGVSTELVSRIERARCLPSVPTLVAIAQALETTPNHILGWEARTSGAEIDALVAVVRRMPAQRRKEVRRIAETLAGYHPSKPRRGR